MTPLVTLPVEERRQLVEDQGEVTLDGAHARIAGWRNDFATVSIVPYQHGGHYSVEFAWPTVKHIIENRNGAFKS